MQTDDSAFEQLVAFFHGWQLELIQLGPRGDQARASYRSSRSHRILHLEAGSALVVRATAPRSVSFALLSASAKAAVRSSGQAFRSGDLVLAGAGASIDLLVPGGAALVVLVRESRAGLSLRALRSLCLRHAFAMSRTVRLDSVARATRAEAVLSACKLVEKRFPASISLSELSRHCGVAQRTLEYGFRQLYDTTPLAYIRSQRLTRNRMALLGARARTSISETARAFGFTHMGQYSRDYRRFFGETPSMTLARAHGALAPGRPRAVAPTCNSHGTKCMTWS